MSVYFWNQVVTTLFSLALGLEVWNFNRGVCDIAYNESYYLSMLWFFSSPKHSFDMNGCRRYMFGLVTTLQNWDTCMQQRLLVL